MRARVGVEPGEHLQGSGPLRSPFARCLRPSVAAMLPSAIPYSRFNILASRRFVFFRFSRYTVGMALINDYYTIAEVASVVGVTVQRIHAFRREGRIPAQRVGSIWLVAKRDAEKFRDKPRKPGRPTTKPKRGK
ncbi:MAG: DNA-binding protein [Rhodocyclaceae bacterium]|nr:MAG: DNA-binding protein [Rhodocyclaceae bacterium]